MNITAKRLVPVVLAGAILGSTMTPAFAASAHLPAKHVAHHAAVAQARVGSALTITNKATTTAATTTPVSTPGKTTTTATATSAPGKTAAAGTATTGTSRIPINQLKVMNYYPSDAAWSKLWGSFNTTEINNDFASIASLGANAVRITVQPSTFGFPTIWPIYQTRLQTMIDLAAANGLSVQLTIFDWYSDWTNIAGSEAWATSLLTPLAGNPNIALIELRNEIDLTQPGATTWVQTMLPFIGTLLPGVPRTISITGTESTSDMQKLDAAAGSNLDVIDVHLYRSMANIATALTGAQAIANGRPIFVGELGQSTFGGNSSCVDAAQARFYQQAIDLAARYSVASIAPWTYTDFTASAVPTAYLGAQQQFGLRRLDGSWKPAADVVRQLFGASSPASVLRASANPSVAEFAGAGDFSCGVVATPADPTSPWSVFGGSLAGTNGTAAGAGETGNSVPFMSGTSGTSAQWPSYMREYAVLTGNPVTFSADARLVSPAGNTQIAIAWYNGTTYLGGSSSASASNTASGWQPLTVTAIPPANATSFQIHLKSAYNKGTVYWDRVNLQSS